MAVSMLLKVEHGRCSFCGEAAELFTLYLEAGKRAQLLPKSEATHSGGCMDCWEAVKEALRGPAVNAASDGAEIDLALEPL